MGMNKEWFGEWFDSPYYHILYKNRDYAEARRFIDHLTNYLQPPKGARVMDLACGKGRHSIYLNEKGLDVTGLDLSAENIKAAKEHSNESLHFFEHDMRQVFAEKEFDYVFNLFTSFGYFDSQEEHLQAIQAVATALKPKGYFLLDFLNPYRVIHNLIPQETKRLDGIDFHINKGYVEGYILKDIEFRDGGKAYHFREKVKAIRHREFASWFEASGLELITCFGDYQLNAYERNSSDRMIFLTRK